MVDVEEVLDARERAGLPIDPGNAPYECEYCGCLCYGHDYLLRRRIAKALGKRTNQIRKIWCCDVCFEILGYHKRQTIGEGREYLIRHYERIRRAKVKNKRMTPATLGHPGPGLKSQLVGTGGVLKRPPRRKGQLKRGHDKVDAGEA
jgi:hypothetical protein